MRLRQTAALALLVVAIGCARIPAAPTDAVGPLRFGSVPSQDLEQQRRELAPLLGLLERTLGRPVELEIPATYKEMARGLAERRWDLVYVGPILYSRAHESGYEGLATPVRDGQTTLNGVLVARKDRGLAGPEELKGRRIAFVDPSSSAGFQYPFALLFAHGLGPGDYESHFLSAHRRVVREVLEGRFDAGATYEGAIAQELELEPAVRDELEIIGRTDAIPGDCLAIRGGSGHRAALLEVLLGMGEAEAAEVLAPMRAQALAPIDEAAYDSARKIDLLVSEHSGF